MVPESISIIVPVYKVEPDEFGQCIRSVLSQTYKSLEIIIVLNGTPDELQKKIKAYQQVDRRITILSIEKAGVSKARNAGIKHATGEWMAFVDADDTIDTCFCEKMLNCAEEHNSDIVACSVCKQLKNSREYLTVAQKTENIDNIAFLQRLLNVQCGVGFAHSKLWRSAFLRASGIQFDETLTMAEDAHFSLQALKYNPRICLLPDALYFYNCANVSAVRSYHPDYAQKYYDSMNAIAEKLAIDGLVYHEQDLHNFIMYHILLICMNYCFNAANEKNFAEQKLMLQNELNRPLFKDAVKKSDYRCLSLSRKAALFCLKHRLYFCLKLIAVIRHRQKEG